MSALDELIRAVEAGQLCTIPTPHPFAPDGKTARVMGYVENYVVMRHKGAGPFLLTKPNVLAKLRALQAKGGAA